MAANDSRPPRQYDVVLWGATGYTGRLVAEFLLSRYGADGDLRWALGGRDGNKLSSVREQLAGEYPAARRLPIVLGDARDRASLDVLARSAKVVCTTVGPYALHGRDLVAACVDAGTDYCDLTGETPFVREMIDLHHERARDVSGARIVHCCGFDSVPSDLGTLLVQEHARAHHGAPCQEVKGFVVDATGGVSGGTAASALSIVEQAVRDPRTRRLLSDPYALAPRESHAGNGRGPRAERDARDQWGLRWDDDLGGWTAPFPMAGVNTRVVRRTNALLDYAWGTDFLYREASGFSKGAKGWLTAAGATAGLGLFVGAMVVPPLRWAIGKTVLPSPGEGPSAASRARGHFAVRFVGVGRATHGTTPPRVFATVRGTSDPGYGETAKMLAESAACLALDEGITGRRGGVLTPASAMGMRLVERLRQAGMSFDVDDA
jgi:short subunit dehydrogenase-like uncharacterized protein